MHASMAEAGKTLESPKFSPEDKPDTLYEMANSDLCVHINKIPLQVVRRGTVMDQAQTLPPHGGSRRSGHLC